MHRALPCRYTCPALLCNLQHLGECGVAGHCKSGSGVGFATLHDTDVAACSMTLGQGFKPICSAKTGTMA